MRFRESIVNDIAREVAYPLYSELAKKTDSSNFSKEDDLCKKLLCIIELVLPPLNEHMPVLVIKSSRTFTFEQQELYRDFFCENSETAKILGTILGKPGNFNKNQIKYTLLAIYGIYCGCDDMLSAKTFMQVLNTILTLCLCSYYN